jgi:hypothetical protein
VYEWKCVVEEEDFRGREREGKISGVSQCEGRTVAPRAGARLGGIA